MEKTRGRPRIRTWEETATTKRLVETRQRLRLSAADMGKYLGVPSTTYASWESGQRNPAASVMRLLDVLGTVEALAPQVHEALMP